MAKKKESTAELSIEDKIWAAAIKLRGNLDASEYRNVVLGLVFLKYISDRFDKRYKELVEEGEGFEEDRDEYTAENVFWVPTDARWNVIADAAHQPNIGVVIDNAMTSIEKDNTRLKNVLPKNYARPELDKIKLGEVVEIFDNVNMHSQGEDFDILGRIYEYCLNQFAAEAKQKGGEFYTPACIVRTLVEVLEPYEGRVYDPACGSGGMFVQSAKFIQNHRGDLKKIHIFGQEYNANTWKMAQMNLAIRGIDADLGSSWGDSFSDDKHATEKFDFVMANPPFNMQDWGAERLANDVRWKYGVPPNGNANFAWIQHMIHHLSPKGKVGLVLANGSLSSQTGGEGEIRKNLLEADMVEGIVALPSQLFFSVQIPACLWFFNRQKKQQGKVLFVDARNMGSMVSRTQRELSEEDILKISDSFKAYQVGTLEDEKGFCATVTLEDIAKQDYILTPGRYVGIAETEDDGEPFQEKMERLTSELSDMFEQSHKLEDEIKKQLATIGFTIK